MRAVIYTRVSSEEQVDNHSLSAQAELASQLAKRNGWQVVHLYEERGRSAKTALRPEFQQMIRDAEAGHFDIIIVHKLDRFSRNIVDTFTFLTHLEKKGVLLTSVTEQDFNFSTPQGRLMLGLMTIFAQWYLDNLSAETSKGKQERARKGSWNGTLIFGYTNLRRVKKDLLDLGDAFKAGKLDQTSYSQRATVLEETLERYEGRTGETDAIPCPFNASGVRLAFETYATGTRSDMDVAQLLNQAGYRTTGNWGSNVFGKDTVTPLLQNRFYLGETSYKGKKKGATRTWQQGNHEPLISAELFERVQQIHGTRHKGRSMNTSKVKRIYMLSGLLYCATCGETWRGYSVSEARRRRYRDTAQDKGQHCSEIPLSVPAETLETQISEIIAQLAIPQDWRERAIQRLQQESPQMDDTTHQRKRLEQQLKRLKDLYVMGDVDEADYVSKRDAIQSELSRMPSPLHSSVIDLENAAQLLGDTARLWSAATPLDQQTWLQMLFQKLYLHHGRLRAAEPTALMAFLLELHTQPRQIIQTKLGQVRLLPPHTPLIEVQRLLGITAL